MANDGGTFEDAAFPIITLVGAFLVLVLALFFNRGALSFANRKFGGIVTIIMSLASIVWFVFLVFTSVRQIAIALFICGLAGLIASLSGNKNTAYAAFIFICFTWLVLIGSINVFITSAMTHRATGISRTANCESYFDPDAVTPRSRDYCKEDGYLQFARIIINCSYLTTLALGLSILGGIEEEGDSKE